MQHEELQCGVSWLRYDFDKKFGELYLDIDHCCDMTGCVNLFRRIDPAVARIQTFSGTMEDTLYVRDRHDGWSARER